MSRNVAKYFTKADLPPRVIREAFHKVYHSDSMRLLNPTIAEETEDEE